MPEARQVRRAELASWQQQGFSEVRVQVKIYCLTGLNDEGSPSSLHARLVNIMTGRRYIDQNKQTCRQRKDEYWTEIDGEKVTPPPAVCYTTDQRDADADPLDAMILWICVRVDALCFNTYSLSG